MTVTTNFGFSNFFIEYFKPFFTKLVYLKVSHTWGSGGRSKLVGVKNSFFFGMGKNILSASHSSQKFWTLYFDGRRDASSNRSLTIGSGQTFIFWSWSSFVGMVKKYSACFPQQPKNLLTSPFLNRRRDPSLDRRLTIGSDQPLFCEVGHPLLTWGYQNFSFWKMLN